MFSSPCFSIPFQFWWILYLRKFQFIYKLILELAKQGKTILINTLEIPEIQKVADYCAVFYNGEIIKILEHQEIDEMTVMMYSTNAAQAEEGK